MIDSDLTIRNISAYYDIYHNIYYLAGLSDTTDYPKDIYQTSISNNTIYDIHRNMTTESTFPVRICCLYWGDNDRKRERIFKHGG